MLFRNLTGLREWSPVLVMLLVLCTIPFRVAAQPNRYGISILTHYGPTVTGSEGQFLSITQDGRGVLYAACEHPGLLEYDGVRWQPVRLRRNPGIHTLVTGRDGVVYAGGVDDFGCLLPGPDGMVRYLSLADSIKKDCHPVSGRVVPYIIGQRVLFCSTRDICIYEPASRRWNVREIPDQMRGCFMVDSLLYLTGGENGLITFDGQRFEPLPGGGAIGRLDISDLVRYDRSRLLAATRTNGVLLIDPESGSIDETFAERGIRQYLKEGIPMQLIRLDTCFAVATQNSGIVILDEEGYAVQRIGTDEGLPDPKVNGLYYGRAEGGPGPLWIARGGGISKLEINRPLTAFTGKAGFEGTITDIASFNDRLFVATTSGLYQRYSTPLSTGFRAVTGLEGEKIRKLRPFSPSRWGSMLIVSSEEKTWTVDPYLHVREVRVRIPDPANNTLWQEEVAGRFLAEDLHRSNTIYTGGRQQPDNSSQLTGLEYARRGWTEVMRADLPGRPVGRTVVDRYGFLWLTTPQMVIRMDVSRLSHVEQRSYTAEQGLPGVDSISVLLDPGRNTLLLGTRKGFYRFDYFGNRFYKDTLLNDLLPPGENLIRQLYNDPEGRLWISFRNGSGEWKEVVTGPGRAINAMDLENTLMRSPGLPAEVFYSDQGEDIWFAKAGSLYHLNTSQARRDTAQFRTLIRKVTLDVDSVLSRGAFREHATKIGHRYDSITFEWATPYFEAEERMMFSTKLEGHDPGWSGWDGASFVVYRDLPPGNYTLHVRARNVYGTVSRPANFAFRILRPWYGSLPAILAYILLAAGGIVLSLRPRLKNPSP